MSNDDSLSSLDPGLVLPFLALGTVSAFLAIGRLSLEVPVARGAFPARGLLYLGSTFLPTGGAVFVTQPAMLVGLEVQYLLAIAGIVVSTHLATAIATAVGCWRLSTGRWVPPWSIVGRLSVYALAIGLIAIGGLALASAWPLLAVPFALAFLGSSVVLFLTPAVLVFERTSLRTAIGRATKLFVHGPGRIVVLSVVVAYIGYLSTGLTTLFGAETLAAYAVGAMVSTTVGGIAHVVALGWLYTTITDGESTLKSAVSISFAGTD